MNFIEWINNSLKGVLEYENWIKVIPFNLLNPSEIYTIKI